MIALAVSTPRRDPAVTVASSLGLSHFNIEVEVRDRICKLSLPFVRIERYETDPCKPRAPAHNPTSKRRQALRSKQRDPNPEDDFLIRRVTSTYKGFHSAFAALFSY